MNIKFLVALAHLIAKAKGDLCARDLSIWPELSTRLRERVIASDRICMDSMAVREIRDFPSAFQH